MCVPGNSCALQSWEELPFEGQNNFHVEMPPPDGQLLESVWFHLTLSFSLIIFSLWMQSFTGMRNVL
jgi:hypothetical protein